MPTPQEFDQWFENFKKSPQYADLKKKPVAFFSAEYGLLTDIPTYAGGLGILAGDFVQEAGDREIPLLAVGLYYREAQNSLRPVNYPPQDYVAKGDLKLVTNEHGEKLLISVPIHHSVVCAQAWQWRKGNAVVYLLDTNVPENQQQDREITARLYTEDREMRLKQEMVLGIGGFRFLQALGFHPSVYHLNEGHSAFLALELVSHEMKHQRTDFSNACEFAKKHIVFTNHTLVAAGQEQFATELVSAMLDKYAEELALPVGDIVALGTIEGSNIFAMTSLSFRLSSQTNGVSKLHASKALEVWPKNPMQSVTNGIYVPRWDKIGAANEGNFWQQHQNNKNELLKYIKKITGEDWDQNTLLFGWARRIVPYKRPLIFVENLEKFFSLAKNSEKPIRLVFSGPTDNQNLGNNSLLLEVQKFLQEKLKGYATLLPNYNMELAQMMVSGCDVWLNTPVVGSEASGTSGMKAALNGALPLTTRDGWIAEVDLTGSGWAVDEPNVGEKMLEIAEREIAPLYYEHITNPWNSKWNARMQAGRKIISEQFSTTRMLKEYIEQLYLPTLAQKHEHKYE